MYKRFIIVSLIILICLCGFCAFGYYSIGLHAEGLAGRREAEFSSVAEQIRIDVKRKIDTFITTEENRPYTDYQYYYVPVVYNDLNALVRSPLGDSLEHGLAYGHFQIEPDGTILTPFLDSSQKKLSSTKGVAYVENIKDNLLGVLKGNGYLAMSIVENGLSNIAAKLDKEDNVSVLNNDYFAYEQQAVEAEMVSQQISQKASSKSKAYSLRRGVDTQQPRYESQSRSNVVLNYDNRARAGKDTDSTWQQVMMPGMGMPGMPGASDSLRKKAESSQLLQSETVQIRIEPFMTVLIGDKGDDRSVFPGQVFMLRHIQIEGDHFIQGFRLNEQQFLTEVRESANRLIRRAMSFEINNRVSDKAVHAAILDSDFGEIVLNLFELEPAWIGKQIDQLRRWYFVIIIVVLVAIAIAQGSLLKNVRAQMALARKKDDFISAVSHELRTPLTSIRMYTEMLENDWVKSEDKRYEYYRAMRQESERLSRLVENVLDFSRIQRGSKKYNFTVGNIDECVSKVVDVMRPAARQAGFVIEMSQPDNPPSLPSAAFDKDAVVQIVINLIDNAIKYAKDADEKIIFVRTGHHGKYLTIEVEDHGPGIPNRQREKVFDAFYRVGDESTRESTGTGLGLALVRKFAQAHNGFVEINSAKPSGVILRVGLAINA